MQWLRDRLAEPSTYAGLAAVLAGVGQVADVSEAPAVADGVAAIGAQVAAGVPWWQAALMSTLGVAAVILKDKGRR